MKSVVTYIRSLLSPFYESDNKSPLKRDRVYDFSSDEDEPSVPYKKFKCMKKTTFPDIMPANDDWEKYKTRYDNVRYVPIQVEGRATTSTPNERYKLQTQSRTVPIQLVGVSENGPSLLEATQKPRKHTPIRPMLHAEIDDEPEVMWVDQRPQQSNKTKSSPRVYVDLDDNEEQGDDDDDVIFVKKVETPKPYQSAVPKPYKYYISQNKNLPTQSSSAHTSPQYYRLQRIRDRRSGSPDVQVKYKSEFKAPAGITKSYKNKPYVPLPNWLQSIKSTNVEPTISRSRLANSLTSNAQTALSSLFNLDEKRNYKELIKNYTNSSKRILSKPTEVVNLVDQATALRSTQRAQKRALNDLNLVERELAEQTENENTKEYDPITVASINSSDSEVEVITPSETSTSSSVRIDPVNSFRDSIRDNAVISSDWLAKLDTKYQKRREETQAKLKNVRREADIISKVNCEQAIAHLERKLKNELSLPESLLEELPLSVELPPLTPAQEKLVQRALGPGPPGQLLVEKFNLRIHRRDLQTLAGLNWLNDEVINFYMNLLMQRSEEQPDLPKVYATNTFFYPKLMQTGQKGLKRWTKKVDIFSHDLMVVPVHLGVHWCLSLVDFQERRISYLDSMGGRNRACLDALLQYLHDEHQEKKGKRFDDSEWKTESLKDIPQQMNGSDCGMFACTFAEFTCRRAPYNFSQANMPYLRRKAALEILQGKLLL